MNIFDILIQYKTAFFLWLAVTLKICILTRWLGIFLGVILWILTSKYKLLKKINFWLSSLIGWIPVLVLLYRVYFPLQQALGINIDSFILATACFVIVNMFMVAKIVNEWIADLPKQYIIAWKLTWLSENTILRKIQIPLIFKYIIWPILIVQITMLHTSIFASLINVDDIFRQIQRVNSIVYKPIELYSLLAIFFVVISVPLYMFANNLKKKYAKDFSERI